MNVFVSGRDENMAPVRGTSWKGTLNGYDFPEEDCFMYSTVERLFDWDVDGCIFLIWALAECH